MNLGSQRRKRSFKFVMTTLGRNNSKIECLANSLVSRGLYDETDEAAKFLEDLSASEYPVEEEENWMKRTDIRGGESVQS